MKSNVSGFGRLCELQFSIKYNNTCIRVVATKWAVCVKSFAQGLAHAVGLR